MKSTGKVIRIISEKKLITNLGEKDGLYRGDEIEIFKEVGEDIIDPETKENLGKYNYVKDTLKVIYVSDKFSICEKPDVYIPNIPILSGSAVNVGMSTWRISGQTIITKLNVDEANIQYLNFEEDNVIRVGDLVRKINEQTKGKSI
jgi:hypothetical protein